MQRCLVHWVRSAKKPSGFPADRGTGIAWHGVAWRAGVMRVRYPHTRGEKEKEGGGGCPVPGEVSSTRSAAACHSDIVDPWSSSFALVCRVPLSVVSATCPCGYHLRGKSRCRACNYVKLSPSSTLPPLSPSLSARIVYVTMSLPGRLASRFALRAELRGMNVISGEARGRHHEPSNLDDELSWRRRKIIRWDDMTWHGW